MAQRFSRKSVRPESVAAAVLTTVLTAVLAVSSLAMLQRERAQVLAHYDFEDEHTPSGPDTHAVFQPPKGGVRASPAVRVSGSYSLEIVEVADDGDVSEFQGYIPEQKQGRLFMHFAFLVATPVEEFNIAFAGPQHFSLGKDGIAIWLAGRNGNLQHYSDSIWRKLFTIMPFVWYFAEISYDIDAGTYDLLIRQEHIDTPVVDLTAQPNAASAPGSSVSKYSFISTPPGRDNSNVTYYIDDLTIWTGAKDQVPSFVAPGRRKFFVDAFATVHEPSNDLEKSGDAEFTAKNPAGAKQYYERALESADAETAWYLRLKLADVAYMLGDAELEKRLREAVYGNWRR